MEFNPRYPFALPLLPPPVSLDSPVLLRAIAAARIELAELKGYSAAIPNPMLLLSPTLIRESVASSEIENIHTTVESVLQQALFPATERRSVDKEGPAGKQAGGVPRFQFCLNRPLLALLNQW